MANTVFISYSHADQPIVERLKQDLRRQGVRIWIDHEMLTPGTQDWEEAIRNGIQGSNALIFVASPQARQSRYVKSELLVAEHKGSTVIPFLIAGDWADAAPMGTMMVTQYIDARGTLYEQGVERLLRTLGVTATAPTRGASGTNRSQQAVEAPTGGTLTTAVHSSGESRFADIYRAVIGINYGSRTMITCQLLGGYVGLLIDLMINRGVDLQLGFEGKGLGLQGFGGGVLTATLVALANTIFIFIYGLPVFGGSFMAISYLGGLLDMMLIRVTSVFSIEIESKLRAAFFWLTPLIIIYTLPPLANWATFNSWYQSSYLVVCVLGAFVPFAVLGVLLAVFASFKSILSRRAY